MNDVQTLGNTYEDTHVTDTLEYRGFTINFYFDDEQKQFYTYWLGKRIEFGVCNTSYKLDMEYIVDTEVDLITYITRDLKFTREAGLFRLSFFKNGGYIDAGLYQNERLVKVFSIDTDLPNSSNYLTATPKKIQLMEDALKFIKNNLK